MIKKSQNKIILLVMLLFFMMVIPNYVNAAKVSVGKVKGLRATLQEANSLTISWNSVSNATGYRVYVYNTSTKKYEYYGKTTKRTITINKLSKAKTYKIKVRAYKTVNGKNYYGSYSSILTTTTKPAQVKNLKTTNQTASTISLSWNKVSRATGYRVYIYNSSTKKYEYYGQSTTNSITIKNLSSSKAYKVKVRAYVTLNSTKYFGSYSSILTTTTKPAQVKNLKATAQTTSTISLSWNKVSRATGYRVYIYNSSTKKYEYYGQSTTNSITIKKLSSAKTYKIKVRAYKTLNGSRYYGAYSSILSAVTKPSQVTGLKASPTTSTNISLSWTAVPRCTGYRVYMYNSSTKKYEYYTQVSTNSAIISKDIATNKALKYSKEYKFKVRAYITLNGSRYYGSYTDVLTTSPVPQVTGVSASSSSKSSIKVSWDKLSQATGYTVYLYSQYSQSYKKYKSTTNTSITISDLDTAKFYKVYVKAYSTVNGTNYYGKRSAIVSQKTKSTSNIRAGIDVSTFQSNINWTSVKKSGVEFAMLRIGYRGYGTAGNLAEDTRFASNIKGSLNTGLEVGVYFFSYAKNTTEAKAEAKWVIDKLKAYNISKSKCKYIAYDFESWNLHRVKGVSVSQINKNAITFLQYVSDAGYTPILYGNYYDLTNRFDTKTILSKVDNCKIWLANYNDTTRYKSYDMWQYSSTGIINGISGNVDLNVINF